MEKIVSSSSYILYFAATKQTNKGNGCEKNYIFSSKNHDFNQYCSYFAWKKN